MLSLVFRRWPEIARQQEWLAITGASDASITSRKVSSLTWETSTIIPIRFRVR